MTEQPPVVAMAEIVEMLGVSRKRVSVLTKHEWRLSRRAGSRGMRERGGAAESAVRSDCALLPAEWSTGASVEVVVMRTRSHSATVS